MIQCNLLIILNSLWSILLLCVYLPHAVFSVSLNLKVIFSAKHWVGVTFVSIFYWLFPISLHISNITQIKNHVLKHTTLFKWFEQYYSNRHRTTVGLRAAGCRTLASWTAALAGKMGEQEKKLECFETHFHFPWWMAIFILSVEFLCFFFPLHRLIPSGKVRGLQIRHKHNGLVWTQLYFSWP